MSIKTLLMTDNERARHAIYELFADTLEQDECDELWMTYRKCRDNGWPHSLSRTVDMTDASLEETWEVLCDQRCEPHEIFNRACEKMTGKPMPHDTCYGCYVRAKEKLYDRC